MVTENNTMRMVLVQLSNTLKAYCLAQGLPYLSADELFRAGNLTARQREWLATFEEIWDYTNLEA